MIDLIDRQAAIELFNDNTLSLDDGAYVQERLKQLPPVKPKMGQWIFNGWKSVCSKCGCSQPLGECSYCRGCGAKMEGVANG